MKNNNIFTGDSAHALFAMIIYQLLMTRKWVTHEEVMVRYMKENLNKKRLSEELDDLGRLKVPVTKCDCYTELKKAYGQVRDALLLQTKEDCIEEDGNNRKKRYRYTGEDKDPLGDMMNSRLVYNLQSYWQFCQDSAGFFPTAWLEHFFKGCKDLLDIKKRKQQGEQVISASLDRQLTNMDKLPQLYEAIREKKVIRFMYHPFFEEPYELTFHPHYLKEFNGRWFLFGQAEEKPYQAFNIAIDRICNDVETVKGKGYIPSEKGFYHHFFDDIIGVTHYNDAQMETILLRTKSLYLHGLITHKPFHPSQKEIKKFDAQDKDYPYGEITLTVKPNPEFYAKLLSYGPGIEVIEPESVRTHIKQNLKEQMQAYFSPDEIELKA